MSLLTQWQFILALLIASSCHVVDAKVFKRCELAKLLRQRHRLDLSEVAQWVCIAQHSSSFNTEAQAFSPSGGSHGLFQISDVYWCSPHGKGAGCNLPCNKLRDDNLSDDLSCIRRIYEEHQRISGDGYTAWNAYHQFCQNNAASYIEDCFSGERKGSFYNTPAKGYNSYHGKFSENSIQDYSVKQSGKVYGRCELARELHQKHKMPMQQIPTWVCIAEHESRFNTAAVGRLNADGSADHGLFQVSDLYWCSHDRYSGGKECGIPCNKLLDNDITDDVRCIKRIHNEHTAISGDGFNAWTVYKPHCQNQRYEQIANCFKNTQQTTLHKVQTFAKGLGLNEVHTTTIKNLVQQTPAKIHYKSPGYKVKVNPSTSPSSSSNKGKVYTRCSLAQELYFKHNFPIQDLSTWVCIAEHESQFNTAAIGRLNTDGSANHGLFQISDRYWCENNAYGGKTCNLPCDKLLDDDLRDDVACIRTIHEEHIRLSGDGFSAWTVYRSHCQNQNIDHIKSCFDAKTLASVEAMESLPSYNVAVTKDKGKIYTKCELAQELYHQHHMPMEQIPKWVCIVQHESSFNTAAVGRLNADGSADHGLFQISDLYWCTHDQHGGKACNIPCDKLLDSDITDDVRCIQIIHEEHTKISGDGFNAWTVYKPHCRNNGMNHIKECFTEKELNAANRPSISSTIEPYYTPSHTKGKIYKKCELVQELLRKHNMPLEQIPTWVCIAQHESSFNTAAVGRLNADGSLDHGLFQISDLYWCSHDQFGGKACNIPCDKLLDSDITDDVNCIKIIYKEHITISGDGFNAWTMYKPHCRNRKIDEILSCFTSNQIEQYEEKQTHLSKPNQIQTFQQASPKTSYSNNTFLSDNIKTSATQVAQRQQVPPKTFYKNDTFLSGNFQTSATQVVQRQQGPPKPYSDNPFLGGNFKTSPTQVMQKPSKKQDFKFAFQNEKPNYANNPFFQNMKIPSGSKVHTTTVQFSSSVSNNQEKSTPNPNYKENPFLNGVSSLFTNNNLISKPAKIINSVDIFKTNPFLSVSTKLTPTVKPTQSSVQYNPFLQTTPASKQEVSKTYLNSNNFRTTTTKPKIIAAKPPTISRTTTRKPTTSWNNYSPTKHTTTTTKKPTSTTTQKTTTAKSTIQRNTTTKKSTNTTTKKPTIITTKKSLTTTKSPKITTNWSWQQQKLTTDMPKITKNWNWHASATTKAPKRTTTTWNWQNQNYFSSTTTKVPKFTTSWNLQYQKYTNNETLAQTATNWSTSKGQTTKSPRTITTTTTRPEITTWNWRNQQKTTKSEPITTTADWRKFYKNTTKKPSSTMATTRRPTQKTTNNWWNTNTKSTTARTTKSNTSTKAIPLDNYINNLKTTTLKPRPTTIAITKTTTTMKPSTTKSQTNIEYNKYKNDPFSHPFFAKVNEQLKKLRSNSATTKLPSFTATKLQSFPQSYLHQDFKNNTLNKTKSIVHTI